MERRTLDTILKDLHERFDNQGRNKRTLLRKYVKEHFNIDIGYVSYEEQFKQFIRKGRTIFQAVDNQQIDQIIQQGVQQYYEDVNDELRDIMDNPLLETDDIKITQFDVEIPIGKSTDKRAYIAFDLRKVKGVDLIIKEIDDVAILFDNVIRPIAQMHFNAKSNALLKPAYKYSLISDQNRYLSTKYISDYQDSDDICNELYDAIISVMENYQTKAIEIGMDSEWTGAEIRCFMIDFFLEPQQRIGNVYKSLSEAYDKYLILDTVARHNCVYNSFYTALTFTKNYKLLVDEVTRQENSKKWKQRQGFQEMFGRERLTIQDIYLIAKQIEVNCILYNNIFEKIDPDLVINDELPTVEFLIKGGSHCIPMIRWSTIQQYFPDKYEELKVLYDWHKDEPEKKEEVIENFEDIKYITIRQSKKLTQKHHPKIAVLDFETWKHNIKQRVLKHNKDGQEVIRIQNIGKPLVYMSGLTWHQKVAKDQYEDKFVNFVGDMLETPEKSIVQNLQIFWNFITNNIKQFHKYIIYAHCGGRFDINLLIRDVISKDQRVMISQKETTEINGSWISFGVHIKGCYIEFRDSYKLFQSKLDDVTKSFCKQYKKSHLDHNVINNLMQKLQTLDKNLTIRDVLKSDSQDELFVRIRNFIKEAEAYHELDCRSLQEALFKLNELFIDKYQMDITNARTISGLMKKYFLHSVYNPDKYPIVKLPVIVDQFIRRSYKGGMNICMFYGFFNHTKFYYYDFNSHYPDVGCKPLPYSTPIYTTFEKAKHTCNQQSKQFAQYNINTELFTELKLSEEEFNATYRHECGCFKGVQSNIFLRSPQIRGGFFEVLVRCSRQQLKCDQPYLAIKKKETLVYPTFSSIHQLVITYPEIQYVQSLGYEVIVRRGFAQQVGKYFEDLFIKLYEQKKQARKDGDECLENLSKVGINSSYGWPGLNINNKDQIIFAPKNTSLHYKYMNEGKLISLCDSNEEGSWKHNTVMRVKSDCLGVDCNVGISAYITAYARIKLHQAITSIQQKGFNVYYCDTDSIITDCKLSDHPDLIERYRPDAFGRSILDKIPKLDKQGNTIGYDIKPSGKFYDKIDDCSLEMGSLKNELGNNNLGEDLGYDELYLSGCKNYAVMQKDYIKELDKDLNSNYLHLDEDEIHLEYDISQTHPDIYKKYKMERTPTYRYDTQQKDHIKQYLKNNYIRDVYWGDSFLQSDVLIDRDIVEKLQLQEIFCYQYKPLLKKQKIKKLKGFKQTDSNVKLNINLYERIIAGETIEQQITMFSTPKFSFVRQIIQLEGSDIECFQMSQIDSHKQFKITCSKGIIDKVTKKMMPFDY